MQGLPVIGRSSFASLRDWHAESEGQLAERFRFYAKPKVVARRYERSSLLLTTNQVVTQWGTIFGDDELAAAILDRLLRHSHTITISGDSYRLKQKR
jgi:hypothetical protein